MVSDHKSAAGGSSTSMAPAYRIASIPRALAPAMSVRGMSPTWAASAGATPRAASVRPKHTDVWLGETRLVGEGERGKVFQESIILRYVCSSLPGVRLVSEITPRRYPALAKQGSPRAPR